MFRLEGIYAPMACLFEGDMGPIDAAALAESTEIYNKTGLSGLVVMGSNGEFTSLSEAEKNIFVKTVKDHIAPDKHVIAGCGTESTRGTIELCRIAADLGAEAALVLSPNYFKKAMQTDRVIEGFYNDVADASPIPVILYNMPGNSGINISSSMTGKLAKHENIIGIKDSGGNIVQITEAIRNTENEDFAVFAGSTSFLMATTLLGGKGGTLALANVLPNECVKLFELTKSGQIEKAVKAQKVLMAANAAVTATYGIGGLKAALDHVGYPGGAPRKPLLPVSEADRQTICGIIDAAIAGMAAI